MGYDYFKYIKNLTLSEFKNLNIKADSIIDRQRFHEKNEGSIVGTENCKNLRKMYSLEAVGCASALLQVRSTLKSTINVLGHTKPTSFEKKCKKFEDEFVKYCEKKYNVSKDVLLDCLHILAQE